LAGHFVWNLNDSQWICINLVMAIDLLGLMGTFGDKGNELRDGKLSVGKDIFKEN